MENIEKKRKRQREWVAGRRATYFADKACVRCGTTNRLELDHIDPEQKVSHRIFSWAKDRMNAELAKCQVLCYLCHKDKSNMELFGKPTFQHGTLNEYYRGCRCEDCRETKRTSR